MARGHHSLTQMPFGHPECSVLFQDPQHLHEHAPSYAGRAVRLGFSSQMDASDNFLAKPAMPCKSFFTK